MPAINGQSHRDRGGRCPSRSPSPRLRSVTRALTALLIDDGPDGSWVAQTVAGSTFCAPALVSWETANVIRRLELAGIVSADQAVQAHVDLLDLAIELWPYELLAARAWELRHNLSIYDAGYAALAELLQSPLVTLDRRLAAAPSLACSILLP